MPLVFPVVLLLILGAVTLASRSTSSFLAASKQSDAQAAREAAESGMSRVLSALNPYAKNTDEPYVSYLLATNWDKSTKNWILGNESKGVIDGYLNRCRISPRGPRLQQTVNAPASRFIEGNLGPLTASNRTLRYRVVDYSLTRDNSSLLGSASGCDAWFNTVTGGSARITVEGWVEINGKRVASQQLTRTVDFDATPFYEDLPDAWQSGSTGTPGPPIGLRMNVGTGLNQLTTFIYEDFDRDSNPIELSDSNQRKLRPLCGTCTQKPTNGITTPLPVGLSGKPSPDLPPRLPDLDDLGIDKPGVPIPSLSYIDSGSPPPNGCKINTAGTEVNCWIETLTSSILTVDTAKRPVNLYVNGDIGSSSPNSYVSIIHNNYNSGSPESRNRWSRLRIYGGNSAQSFHIKASPTSGTGTSLDGSFVWAPKAVLRYGDGTQAAPPQILATWWVDQLELSFSPGTMNFITPLYGNPQVLNAILPGGYMDASGTAFTRDPRFPAVPVLMRVRSTY